MESPNRIWYVSLLLSLIAGYCDTITFVAAGAVFSAHVTGNFIVFAYQLVKGPGWQDWIKLLTFPVFILAVMVGGRITARAGCRYTILAFAGIMLVVAGGFAWLGGFWFPKAQWATYAVIMLVVSAMGLQNAFGKRFAKETFGPTTMMTGNVTQAALDLGNLSRNKWSDRASRTSLVQQAVLISGFLSGCFLGALAGTSFGLGAVTLPGVAVLACYFLNRNVGDIKVLS